MQRVDLFFYRLLAAMCLKFFGGESPKGAFNTVDKYGKCQSCLGLRISFISLNVPAKP